MDKNIEYVYVEIVEDGHLIHSKIVNLDDKIDCAEGIAHNDIVLCFATYHVNETYNETYQFYR